MLHCEPWSEIEIAALLRKARKLIGEGVTSERGLAKAIASDREFRERTHAAIYVKIRELNSAGRGWWSTKGAHRTIVI
jgi:hypothetical protein